MISIEKNIKIKKKIVIFDVDGVLLNSKINMSKSWKSVQKEFGYKDIGFQKYFDRIGQPFEIILKQLGIENNFKNIKNSYDKESIRNKNLVKYYPGVIKELKILKSLGFVLCIVTSKDRLRTNLLISKTKKYFRLIQCPEKNLKGKPFPDQLLKVINKLKVKKKECVYIGDTNFDFLAAKRAKIDFIFATWGYSLNQKYKYSINKINDLHDILELV